MRSGPTWFYLLGGGAYHRVPYSDDLGLTWRHLSDIPDVEIVSQSKPRSVSGARWTEAEEKALVGLAKNRDLDWQERAEGLGKLGYGLRTARALQDRFRLIQARESDDEDQDGEGQNARNRAVQKHSECIYKLIQLDLRA